MSLFQHFRLGGKSKTKPQARDRRQTTKPGGFRPRLEYLEDRTLLNAATPFSAGPATHFLVEVPANTQVGLAAPVVVEALNASNHIVNNYTGTVSLSSTIAATVPPSTSSGTAVVLPTNYTFTTRDHGEHTFAVTSEKAGSQTVTATDTTTASITGSAVTTVNPAPVATHFLVVVPQSATVGQAVSFWVIALSASNQPVPSYTGTVAFSSSPSAATLPPNYTFTAADHGVHTFTATFGTAGSETLTATDTVTSSITGSASTTVNAAPVATHFQVVVPANATVGSAVTFVVSVLDASNRLVPSYTGTVAFSVLPGTATLPSNYTFTASDHGVHVFNATFGTAGSQTLTTTDTMTASITGSATVTVSAAPVATHFQVLLPAHATVGTPVAFSVVALSASNQPVPTYTGTVAFSVLPGTATLPGSYKFTASDHGTHAFTATFGTAGSQTLTATDSMTATITGSATTTVTAPVVATTKFLIIALPPVVAAGTSFNIIVVAVNSLTDQIETNYTGTVQFTSTDSVTTVKLPANYTFTASDGGEHVFSVTLQTSGTQTITATDTSSSSITGSTTVRVT